MEDKKLLKVTLEFEDETKSLEGEWAQKWLKAVDGVIGLHQLRGYSIPGLDEVHKHWKIEKK